MTDVRLLTQACLVGAASRASSQAGLWHAFGSLFSVLKEWGESVSRDGRLAYLLFFSERIIGSRVSPDLSWAASRSLPCVVFPSSW